MDSVPKRRHPKTANRCSTGVSMGYIPIRFTPIPRQRFTPIPRKQFRNKKHMRQFMNNLHFFNVK